MNKTLRNNLLHSLSEEVRSSLIDLLNEKIDWCSDITKYPPKVWEEVLGRQEAAKILKDIFKFLNPKSPITEGKRENYL